MLLIIDKCYSNTNINIKASLNFEQQNKQNSNEICNKLIPNQILLLYFKK